MSDEYINPNQSTLKKIQSVHKAVVFGLMAFIIICIFLYYSGKINFNQQLNSRWLQIVIVAVCGLGYFCGRYIFKQAIKKAANTNLSIQEKLKTYLGGSIIFYACLEIPALSTLAAFVITGNFAYFLLGCLILILLWLVQPSAKNVAYQIGVPESDI